MGTKKTVFLSPETVELCENLSIKGRDIKYSGTINGAIKMFVAMIEDSKPDFTEQQWNALYCSFNGRMIHQDIKQECSMLHITLDQNYQYDSQVKSFLGDESSAIQFIKRVQELSLSSKISVIYHSLAFWGRLDESPE